MNITDKLWEKYHDNELQVSYMARPMFEEALEEHKKHVIEEYEMECKDALEHMTKSYESLIEEYKELQLKTDVCYCDDQSQWHDLVKNPKDLPEQKEGSFVLTDIKRIKLKNGTYCEAMYDYCLKGWFYKYHDGSTRDKQIFDVIAWRELPSKKHVIEEYEKRSCGKCDEIDKELYPDTYCYIHGQYRAPDDYCNRFIPKKENSDG